MQSVAARVQHERGHAQVGGLPVWLKAEAVAGAARLERPDQLAHDMIVMQGAPGVFPGADV